MMLKDRKLAHNDSERPEKAASTAHVKAISQHLTTNWDKANTLPPEQTYTLFLQDDDPQFEYTSHNTHETSSVHPTSYVTTYLTIFSRSRSSVKPSSKHSLPDETLRRRDGLECPLVLLWGEQAGEISFLGDCSEWCRLGARPLGSTNRKPHFDSSLSKNAP